MCPAVLFATILKDRLVSGKREGSSRGAGQGGIHLVYAVNSYSSFFTFQARKHDKNFCRCRQRIRKNTTLAGERDRCSLLHGALWHTGFAFGEFLWAQK
jgi:hypothetical protein